MRAVRFDHIAIAVPRRVARLRCPAGHIPGSASTQNPTAAQLYERLGFDRRVGAADHTHLMKLR